MDPETIHDSQFTVVRPFLYQHDGFTAALGVWGPRRHFTVGMRWDGAGEAPGFPLGRDRRPKWFVVPPELAESALHALLDAPGVTDAESFTIKSALATLKADALHSPAAETLRELALGSRRYEEKQAQARAFEANVMERLQEARPVRRIRMD